jgi:adenylate cyclase
MTESDRRLAAILFTDIVGYTAMTQENESGALAILKEQRNLVRPIFAKHGGREVKTMGDGFLVEFASALAATLCALEIESTVSEFNKAKASDLKLRIGIHVGDVVYQDGDIFGDAVNIASRIEPLAWNGGICISQQVYDQVRNKVPAGFTRIEAPGMKNVSVPIDVYRLEAGGEPQRGVSLRGRKSLAVLPFANMSPDPDDEYFADGVTEEIISTIAKVEEIGVISRTSVMQYKKSPKSIKQVSNELGVGTVLEGSVRKADNKVRVTVQLIDAISDQHLWAESYDRELRNIFEIQSDIAKQVAEALKLKILPGLSAKLETKPTASTDAYTLYLKGRYHWNKRSLEDVRLAAQFFEKAIDEDPGFALGYVGLGDCYRTLVTNWGIDPAENAEKAAVMVRKALHLDPDLAEAHASNGLSLFGGYKLAEAEDEFRRAISSKANFPTAHQWYAQLLIAETRWEDALSHIEKAVELDPLSQVAWLVHVFFYEAKRDYVNGLPLAEKAVNLNPNSPALRLELALFYAKLDMPGEARREAKTGVDIVKESYPYAEDAMDAMLASLGGDRETVRRLLPALEAHQSETFTARRFIADLHFFLGDVDEGFEWLEKSYANKEFDLFYIKSNEYLDEVRSDRRYLDLVERLGLA